jgi:hypothetical protein
MTGLHRGRTSLTTVFTCLAIVVALRMGFPYLEHRLDEWLGKKPLGPAGPHQVESPGKHSPDSLQKIRQSLDHPIGTPTGKAGGDAGSLPHPGANAHPAVSLTGVRQVAHPSESGTPLPERLPLVRAQSPATSLRQGD